LAGLCRRVCFLDAAAGAELGAAVVTCVCCSAGNAARCKYVFGTKFSAYIHMALPASTEKEREQSCVEHCEWIRISVEWTVRSVSGLDTCSGQAGRVCSTGQDTHNYQNTS
jgi:hypothetical protein